MNTVQINKLPSGLLSILVYALMFGLPMAAFVLWMVPWLESWPDASENMAATIRRAVFFALVLVSYVLFMRTYERRPMRELAFKPVLTALYAVAGVAMIGAPIALLYAADVYQVQASNGWSKTLGVLGVILILSLAEEIVFRGVIFQMLEKSLGTIGSLATVALLFGAAHVFNDGTTVLSTVSVVLIGAFWTALYALNRNIWAIGLHHGLWNLTILCTGVPLSGTTELRPMAPFSSSMEGPLWLTGGAFGPEASLLTVIWMVLTLFVLFTFTKLNPKNSQAQQSMERARA